MKIWRIIEKNIIKMYKNKMKYPEIVDMQVEEKLWTDVWKVEWYESCLNNVLDDLQQDRPENWGHYHIII
jgi:hypothetical protein